MNKAALEQQLRTALSWREQVRRARAAAVADAAAGRRDAEQLAFDETTLDAQDIAAQTHLEDLRRQIGARLSGLGEQLQELLRERGHLARRAADGKVSAADANRESHRILEKIEALRSEIQSWNHLLHADTPEALGGFLDLPIDDYAPAVDVRRSAAAGTAGAAGGFWRENGLTLALAFVALVVAVSGIFYVRVWGDAVAFQAFLPAAAGEPLQLECHNTTMDTVTWHVPWGSATDPARNAFGVNLLLREKGGAEFRLFAPTQPVWSFEGTPTEHADPIQVPSGLTKRVSLDVGLLKGLAPNAEGLLVQCTDAGGAVRFSVAVDPL